MTDQLVNWLLDPKTIAYLALLVAQIAVAFRVIMRRLSVGESLAWIFVVFIFPVVGLLIYLMFGELRLGVRRAQRMLELTPPIRQWVKELLTRRQVDWNRLDAACKPLSLAAERGLGIPALPGNSLEMIDDWKGVFRRLIEDIDQAKSTCHMEFYIWHSGGEADAVAEAVKRARRRGVTCRLLLDGLGSHRFLRSTAARDLRDAGVLIQEALPGGLLRLPFVRFDIRMHRKIVVIDGAIAYTGSLNLVDPRYFKQESGVGQWVDAMVRVQGPAVEALAITFLADWFIETEDTLESLRDTGDADSQPHRGEAAVQVLPSGPSYRSEVIEQLILTGLYAAREELVLTTPYFVPSESLLVALQMAARRGVKVILIVPEKVDSLLVRFASKAGKGDLMKAGVRIANFQGGLLHTKSVTIDGEISLFGSLNLDPRSFRLNFEISLVIYDREFSQRLRQLQQSYIDQSQLMNLELWEERPLRQKIGENVARMLSPLL